MKTLLLVVLLVSGNCFAGYVGTPDGGYCVADDQCATGYCVMTKDGTEHRCRKEKLEDGAKCWVNNDCKSDACYDKNGGRELVTRCSKVNRDINAHCEKDADCDSNNCVFDEVHTYNSGSCHTAK